MFVLDTILIESLNDIENRKDDAINSSAEHFEKNVDDVHRKSRKITRTNSKIVNENVVALLDVQKRIDQFQLNDSLRDSIMSKRTRNSRNTIRENSLDKRIRADKRSLIEQEKFQNELIIFEIARKTVSNSASSKISKTKKIMHIDNAFKCRMLIIIKLKTNFAKS